MVFSSTFMLPSHFKMWWTFCYPLLFLPVREFSTYALLPENPGSNTENVKSGWQKLNGCEISLFIERKFFFINKYRKWWIGNVIKLSYFINCDQLGILELDSLTYEDWDVVFLLYHLQWPGGICCLDSRRCRFKSLWLENNDPCLQIVEPISTFE